MVEIPRLMQTCLELASGAGAIVEGLRGQVRTVEYKGAVDLVTDADRASEQFLLDEVRRRHPDHSILAEESGAFTQGAAQFVWVIDPLDGTTNYAHGFPHYNVSVAVCAAPLGVALAGCVLDPTRGEAFIAGRGEGAWLISDAAERVRLSVSPCESIGRSLLATGFPYDRHQHDDNNHAEHEAFNVGSHGVRRAGAAALDLAYVAAGRLDGYWEAHLKPWDVAAGALLVLEAGGVVTGYDGAVFTGRQSAVVTSGPALHAAILSKLRDVRTSRGFPPVPARSQPFRTS